MAKKRVRNYQKENEYKKRPEQIAARVKRNAARRLLIREGKVTKGDGTHVNHIVALSKGGSNDRKNLINYILKEVIGVPGEFKKLIYSLPKDMNLEMEKELPNHPYQKEVDFLVTYCPDKYSAYKNFLDKKVYERFEKEHYKPLLKEKQKRIIKPV